MVQPNLAGVDLSASTLLAAMSEAVYVVDQHRTITFWNHAAEVLTGFSGDEVVGRECHDGILNHVDECGASLCGTRCPLAATMRDGRPRETVAFLHHRDGHRLPVSVRAAPLRDALGVITGAVEVFHDDTRSRNLESRLERAQRQAATDPLTGLVNRRRLSEVLRARREEQLRYGRTYAVLFADIDHFKMVNDTHGHDAGDRVLQVVASTLRDCARSCDVVGRWGGEEFLFVVTVADAEEAAVLADRARNLVSSAWVGDGPGRILVTMSIGVAVPAAAEPTRQVVSRADAAMRVAKASGRNRTAIAGSDH